MAESVLLEAFSDEDKEFLQTTLDCDGDEIFDIFGENLYLPLAFARQTFELPKQIISILEKRFSGTLRPEQKQVQDYVMRKLVDEGYATISARPGFGKTITSISIACKLGLKTLIIVNKLVLIDQWISSISGFAPDEKVCVVRPTDTQLDPSATFYIVNAINISKKTHQFWGPIKFLIVDELHQIITKKLVVGILRIVPAAILGLSATPYRHDAYNKAIGWFFGQNVIGQDLNQKHHFRVVSTGFTPTNIQYNAKGLDWGKILEEQAENTKRNEHVVRECLECAKTRTILVLVKRVSHAETLAAMIKEKDPSVAVATLVRSERTFDKNCKILIGTTSKIGVGFDHAPIDCLVVASDIKNYFVQFLGRCMRNPDVIPIIVDFDDNFSILRKHLLERIKEYKKHGGIGDEITLKEVVQPKLRRWFAKK